MCVTRLLLHVVCPSVTLDTIGEFNVDSKAEYSALSSTRSQKKKLKQTTQCPTDTVQVKIRGLWWIVITYIEIVGKYFNGLIG